MEDSAKSVGSVGVTERALQKMSLFGKSWSLKQLMNIVKNLKLIHNIPVNFWKATHKLELQDYTLNKPL